ARALFLLATLEGIAGKPDAGPLWEALAHKYPQSSLADDALFNQSLAERRAGNREGERALLRDLIDNHLDSDLRTEAIFRFFWSYWTEGKGRQGLALLDQLAAHPDPDGAEQERARYWRARVLLEPQPDESDLARAAARGLTAIDRGPARAAIDSQLGQEPLMLLADLYARAGDFRNAHALVRTDLRWLLRRPADALALRAAALAYPLAFRDQIAHVSKSASIPPDLLQALMREESALDPRALSATGALGLTQVMPATARMLARKLRIHDYQTARLFDPSVNIRIGGAYLGELYARFQHPALALASYNAGPGNVAGWLKVRGSLPLDAFVEEIPLDETRGYVKRCLRSFAAYQFLYSNGRMPALGQTLAA